VTVIAGAIDKDGTVFMGCDGVALENGRVKTLRWPKVRLIGDFLIGVAGSMRVMQIAHHCFSPPTPAADSDLLAYMVNDFVDALRVCMKEKGGESKGDGDAEEMNGCLLVARDGRLFEVDSAYAVIELREPYHAVGCANQEARCAMHARRGSRAKSIVKAGLEGAAAYDINIRPPFTIESIKKK
jgi:ATP-dependent protease HslVU (ClpYQ) peptidase subunit